jgi:hypothetical protein
LGLTAASNKYACALFSKAFGDAETNAGAATGDDSDSARELARHRYALSP